MRSSGFEYCKRQQRAALESFTICAPTSSAQKGTDTTQEIGPLALYSDSKFANGSGSRHLQCLPEHNANHFKIRFLYCVDIHHPLRQFRLSHDTITARPGKQDCHIYQHHPELHRHSRLVDDLFHPTICYNGLPERTISVSVAICRPLFHLLSSCPDADQLKSSEGSDYSYWAFDGCCIGLSTLPLHRKIFTHLTG